MYKKILVTGAAGFIGSHLVEELVKNNEFVRIFIRYNSRNDRGWIDSLPKKIVDELEIFTGDLKDADAVTKAVNGTNIVYNLGAVIAIPYSYINPNDFVQTNVNGTANVLSACLANTQIERLIQISTSEVYGTAQYVPIDEKHPLQPQSPYSASKIASDSIAMSYNNAFSLPVTIARPFNTYGPRQSARAVIPTIITQLASGMKNIKLGDTRPTRDLNYVEDTCKGIIAVAESNKTIGETINIGSNKEASVQNVFDTIAKIMGVKAKVQRDEIRIRPEKSEVMRLLCDNTKLIKLTGYKHKYTLEAGLKKTIDWFTDAENLKKYKTDIYNV